LGRLEFAGKQIFAGICSVPELFRLRGSKDVKEFYLGGTGDRRNNFKSFRWRKRWL